MQRPYDALGFFEQKRRYGRTDLKIFFVGLNLNGPDDPAITSLFGLNNIPFLAENYSRMADAIRCCQYILYSQIERVGSFESAISILTRFTDLKTLVVYEPVQDVELFLDALKNLSDIVNLKIFGNQPQDLFDRLPENCAIQQLSLWTQTADLDFLFRLDHLVELCIAFSIDAETIAKAWKELRFLSRFEFSYLNQKTRIKIPHPRPQNPPANRIKVSLCNSRNTFSHGQSHYFSDLNVAIKFSVGQLDEPKKKKCHF